MHDQTRSTECEMQGYKKQRRPMIQVQQAANQAHHHAEIKAQEPTNPPTARSRLAVRLRLLRARDGGHRRPAHAHVGPAVRLDRAFALLARRRVPRRLVRRPRRRGTRSGLRRVLLLLVAVPVAPSTAPAAPSPATATASTPPAPTSAPTAPVVARRKVEGALRRRGRALDLERLLGLLCKL